jgi:hypothetical protein
MNEETNYRRFWRNQLSAAPLLAVVLAPDGLSRLSCFLCGVGGAVVAYYNEIDPHAAQHLRNLIDAGHIAPGVVDTRSIEDVTPNDLTDSISAISSPGSADGRSRCVAQDGPTVARHGQHHAPASLSARQAKDLGLLTSGTYGPPHIGLSASAALSWSLASNLAALTRTTGSTLYKLTWKPWAMPSGRLRFRLRASARRTRETVLIGWPTPIASNGRARGISTDRG